ncbi:MAG: isopeptide-forming domain-containing fimbrial protein [Pyrinomonadaceae bacterium]
MLFQSKLSKSLSAVVVAILLSSFATSRTRFDSAPAGTIISNRAEATYESDGTTFNAVSETVTFTVLAVASLTVRPKETVPSASVVPQERITRLFRICNTGNVVNSYTVTDTDVTAPASFDSLYFDNDASGTLTTGDTLITVGTTSSATVAPGLCVGVLAIVDTNAIPFSSLLRIHLTARSNATGAANVNVVDDGTILNEVGKGPLFSNPTNPALPPLKEVNNGNQAVVTRGNPFTYSIAFRNSGDVSARNTVLTDDLPAGIEYVAGSLHLDYNGSNKDLTDAQDADEGFVSGQHIELRLASLAPDQVVRLSFRAQLNNSAPAAIGIVNVAQLVADNATLTKTNSVVVVVDPFGTVFAGRGGASFPVPGARVAVYSDQALTNLLPLPAELGFVPNVQNGNPFASDNLGHFSFGLSPSQVGTPSTPSRYFISVRADRFIPRLIQIEVRAGEAGLVSLTERALDGQPIAVAGGFTLVREDVQIDGLADLAFNIPVFEEHGLEIIKSVDQQRAEIGDVVTYRIEVHNPTAASVSNVTVRDHLPESFHYVQGTARLSVGSSPEQQIEPEATGGDLVFRLSELGPGAGARLLYRVRIGANAREGEMENVAIGSGTFPNGERIETGAARAIVRVGGGVFSTRQIILGRVFEDVNRNGAFDAGDKPVSGARLYLTNGQSVITDSQGLYNFPSLGDGSQVIALDPVTVPSGFVLTDGKSVSGRSWTRLLRTPIGGGALLRQNFMLVSSHSDDTSATLASEPPSDKRDNKSLSSRNQPSRAAKALAPGVNGAGNPPASVNPAAGVYEFTSTENLDPVAPGTALILSPASDSVVMAPAMELVARVALNWTVKLEVNGEQVSDQNIGTRRFDNKNQVTTFTFVSVNLRPGPNRVTVTPLSPVGTPGTPQQLIAIGRGPIARLEVVPEKTAIQAGGRDSTLIKIRAFDKWGHPANDNQVGIESSLGQLVGLNQPAPDDGLLVPGKFVSSSDLPTDVGTQPKDQGRGQLIIPMENGEAAVKLIGPAQPGEARLHVVAGQLEMESLVRVLPESRPTILVGLAEMSFGNAIPEVSLRGEEGNRRNHVSFFFSGRLWGKNSLTLSYDSQRAINRTTGHDRIFQLDPLDRAYPVFGDSSTRYEAAASNSKLYARLDHGRSYAMFGDLDADMEQVPLAGYTRKLTGVKLHLENNGGDFVTVTGAKPDTSFARDVFPAGALSIIQLSHGEILQGSETVAIEVRDRRNPEVIISRELLARSLDYNLNAGSGELFLLRLIPTFDSGLNLKQIVVTYEHRATGLNSSVYTARGRKNFEGLGLKLGFSTVLQRQEAAESFLVGGLDLEKSMPRRGLLRVAWATSRGEISNGINSAASPDGANTQHDGNALSVDYQQPVAFHEGVLHARFQSASAGFLNPFGATVTPGSRRGEVTFDFKPRRGAILRFGLVKEDNQTENVDNKRLTFSVSGEQVVKERVRLHFGYDHRNFVDNLNSTATNSDLLTVGAQVQLTDKLDVSIKREQNIGEADPTYPNQTTLAANYKVNQWTKIFLTERMASAAIRPIGDLSQTGFAGTNARHETALGVESRFGKYTALVGRYQIENGIDGSDSFAVLGIQNRVPVTKALSLDLGFERGFHLAGEGKSFSSATIGFGWTPNDSFKASAHYEFRDRSGNGQLLAFGAAGRLTKGITVLSRLRLSESSFEGRDSSGVDGLAALAYRPLNSDRAGLLFSFNHRSLAQSGTAGVAPTRDRLDTLATDGYYQATERLELYGRFALRFAANGEPALPFVSTLTYLAQARAQYRLTSRIDWAGETRLIMQPSSRTYRSVYGTEIGFWALPDLRFGLGYNFTRAGEPGLDRAMPRKQGFYFTISSKLSSLFDLFGTSRTGLATSADSNAASATEKTGEKK